MEDLAVITALNHSVSFGKNFIKFKEKQLKCYLPALRSVHVGKNCAAVIKTDAG